MRPEEKVAITETILFLNGMADRMEKWAKESREGGWSTHQVEQNISLANECRRKAAKLRNATA